MSAENEFENDIAHAEASGDGAEPRAGLALWKKVAFALALVVGLVGVGMTQMGGDEVAPAAGASGDPAVMPNALGVGPLGGGTGGTLGTGAQEEPSPWGPFFMKGGLSFAVAFAAGYALRTFLKMTIVLFGLVALAIFGLQKLGVIGEIDWTKAQGYWDSLTANVGQQFESFKTFLTGSVPSAGMGTLGLISGFRR